MIEITKNMTIGEITQNYPQVIETLLSTGVHCIGCGAAYWETLEAGLKGHGMDDQRVEEVVIQLNKVLTKEPNQERDIDLTSKAAIKIKELMKKGSKGNFLRLGISPGGCSGFSYRLSFDKGSKDTDMIFKEKGVSVLLDKSDFDQLKGIKIDFIDALEGSGFKISNPNATSSCGCGQSFR